jgi:hypothetical protein
VRKKVIGIFIILLYSFPYVYFSMYQDLKNSSMVGYLIMIVSTTLISFLGSFFINAIALIIGNIVSAMVSLYLINKMGVDWGVGYFKPFSPIQLLGVVSVLNLVPQIFAVALANGFKLNKF